MSIFENWAKFDNLEKIKYFIKSLGYEIINDSLTQNQIFENDNSIIIISKKNSEDIEKNGGYKK